MRISERLYRFLLRVLPSEFRGDFSDAMLADVGAVPRGSLFWLREIAGLLGAVVREHADALRQDVKYALRIMRRTPGFTLMAIVMLALGTGVNVAMFSVVDAVLIKSPFRDGRQIVRVLRTENGRSSSGWTLDAYRQLVDSPGPLSAVAVFSGGGHLLTGPGGPRAPQFECVSASMFDVLGTSPLLGRPLSAADDRAGAEPMVVLEYKFWQQLGGTPAILGSPLMINGRPVTVAGVMPRGYTGPLSRLRVDGWMPLFNRVEGAGQTGCLIRGTVAVFGRVQPSLTIATAQAAMPSAQLLGLERSTFDDWRTELNVLSAAVVFILLIACANVGGLQLERTMARRREMAVRTALGASRGRLARQLLTENLLLAFGGAAAGVGAAYLSLQGVVKLMPIAIPHLSEIAVNGRVLGAAVVIAAFAGVIAGLVPILHLTGAALSSRMSASSRSSTGFSDWTRRGLIVAQIALSITVLVGAGLMIRTFLTLRPDNPGFDPSNKLLTLVRIPGRPPAAAAQHMSELADVLRQTAGVTDVAIASHLPMYRVVSIERATLGPAKSNVFAYRVTPQFIPLLKIPVLRGRGLGDADRSASDPVIVVNDHLARRIRPDGQVVGMSLETSTTTGTNDVPVPRRIVGVVDNLRSDGLDLRPRPELYAPYAEKPPNNAWLIVGIGGANAEGSVRAAMQTHIRGIGPDIVVEPTTRMADMLGDQVRSPRLGAWLLGVFGALSLGLAAAGLMTTIGWWVRQRTREIGIRIALGAAPGRVAALVIRQGLTLVVIGVIAGCAAAAGLTRYMREWIYGITPLDPGTFAGAAALMLAIAAAAIYVPMRRATRVDPVTALRTD